MSGQITRSVTASGGRRIFSYVGAAILLIALSAARAQADVAVRTPWHPIAAATLYGDFAARLDPVDWAGIADRYKARRGKFADQGPRSVYEMLAPVSRFSGDDLVGDIKKAIAAADVPRFRSAALRAAAITVRYHLDRARVRLDKPRGALSDTLQAKAVYRTFTAYMRNRDPVAFRRLGLAWLDLTTIAGRSHAGPAARSAFLGSVSRIAGYLAATFEKDTPEQLEPEQVPLPPDAHIINQTTQPRAVLNFEKRNVDERKLFLVAYGDMLFDSPEIFGQPARRMGITCSGCHNRGDANPEFFIPGLSRHRGGLDVDSELFNARGNDHRFDPVDIPSLRGIRFTGPYGRDGRLASLREFTRNVIVGEFGGAEPTPLMLDALVAYQREFDFLPNPALDADGKLVAGASEAARRGEVLFFRKFPTMGGRACADCHLPESNFVDGRRHDIGSGGDGGFDTPTLLGAKYTPPYFHDGSQATLEDVVGWFDRRFKLGFDSAERRDLTAYLQAVGGGTQPYETFDGRRTPFRLAFEEISTFLSTLDTLLPARDRHHASLLLRSVARDLRTDAGGMNNIIRAPWALDLADRLDKLRDAVDATRWAQAEKLWQRYKAAEKRYGPQLY